MIHKITKKEKTQPKTLFDQLKLTIELSSELLSLLDFLNQKGYRTKSNKHLKFFEAYGVKICNLIRLLELMFNEQFISNEHLVRFNSKFILICVKYFMHPMTPFSKDFLKDRKTPLLVRCFF